MAEVLLEMKADVYFKRIGIQDRFGQSGKPEMLFEEYSLREDDIALAVEQVIFEKNRIKEKQ